jgi:hypothetical protein
MKTLAMTATVGGLLLAGLLAVAASCACYVVLPSGEQVWCDDLTYNAHPPTTRWEDWTVTCNQKVYKLGELKAVVSQR